MLNSKGVDNEMPRRTEDVGTEATPHFDGKREGFLNDSKGVQMGIRTEVDETKDPFLNRKKDDELKRFEELTRGDPVEDEH